MATGKRRQTFEKMNRERRVREKRALKAEKREQRKLDAIAGTTDGDAATDGAESVEGVEGEAAADESTADSTAD